ncbi:MAG: hypothetical protein RL264_2947 [Bacteroidota bacterium]|jgi:DNA helicase-2/ATP-dependent DNA helicase PcrA
MSYLDELNDSQRAAVENIFGPTMVIAGAGSGKTRVLTYRIAHMIDQGVDPFHILALTFTNKAAREMTERISKIIGGTEARNISMGTFHSVFSRILRINADRIGYPTNFTIYDTSDSKSLMKAIIKELNLDDKVYKASNVLGRISNAKNNLVSPEMYCQDKEIQMEDRDARRPEMGRLYTTYVNRCQKAGAMDFDDLLYFTNVLLQKFPDVLHYYQQKFRFILVDEYQDTNYAQYSLVKLLAAAWQNICVVGDDAQSIYSFRGANIENILNFRKDYPDFKLFKLEQNYRSTKTIVEAANYVIQKNKEQIFKKVWTDNSQGNKIAVVRNLNDSEEGQTVTNRIFDLIHSGEASSYNDIAVLYRTNKQSRAFEENLRRRNIPYKIYGALSFYQRKEIKDVLAYFRMAINPHDEEALKRVINYPKRSIGPTTVQNIIIAASQYNVSMWDVITNANQYPFQCNAGTRQKIDEFATLIKSFTAEIDKKNAFTLADVIIKSSGIYGELKGDKDKGPEEVERFQNIDELLNGIRDFVKNKEEDEPKMLTDFMSEIALVTDADTNKEENPNHVSMMTIHASKGLEFQHVFIVGLEENLFPSQMSIMDRDDLEEERRLFYVAITRAMKSCTLTYATSRFTMGKIVRSEPSRFLDEIPAPFLNEESIQRPGGGRSLNVAPRVTGGLNRPLSGNAPKLRSMSDLEKTGNTVPSDATTVKVGYLVEHERFGKGRITAVEGEGVNKKATIFFAGIGAKTLILQFAKLKVIENEL